MTNLTILLLGFCPDKPNLVYFPQIPTLMMLVHQNYTFYLCILLPKTLKFPQKSGGGSWVRQGKKHKFHH